MTNYFSLRTINEMRLSEKLNPIRLADGGVTYSDLPNQVAISYTIAGQIVNNRSQYKKIDSSTEKLNFVTLKTKIKLMRLKMKKKNAREVGRICKIDRKTAKYALINREKWFNCKIMEPI